MASAAVLGLLLLPLSGTPAAPDFRCGMHLINIGATEAEVRGKCGEPTSQFRKTARGRRGVVTTRDEWTYNLGPTQFVRILVFDAMADRLVDIALGGYGS